MRSFLYYPRPPRAPSWDEWEHLIWPILRAGDGALEADARSVGVQELARFLDINTRTLHRLVRAGVLVKDGHGAYPLQRNVRRYLTLLRLEALANRRLVTLPTGERSEKLDHGRGFAPLETLDKFV